MKLLLVLALAVLATAKTLDDEWELFKQVKYQVIKFVLLLVAKIIAANFENITILLYTM